MFVLCYMSLTKRHVHNSLLEICAPNAIPTPHFELFPPGMIPAHFVPWLELYHKEKTVKGASFICNNTITFTNTNMWFFFFFSFRGFVLIRFNSGNWRQAGARTQKQCSCVCRWYYRRLLQVNNHKHSTCAGLVPLHKTCFKRNDSLNVLIHFRKSYLARGVWISRKQGDFYDGVCPFPAN